MKKLILLIVGALLCMACEELTKEERALKALETMYEKAGDEWTTTLKALEMTEAECWGMFSKEDNKERTGELGLTKKHVEEVNHIFCDRYSISRFITDSSYIEGDYLIFYDDRSNGFTARHIFTIYNSEHNPKYDKDIALLLLRPNANSRYKTCFAVHWESYSKLLKGGS